MNALHLRLPCQRAGRLFTRALLPLILTLTSVAGVAAEIDPQAIAEGRAIVEGALANLESFQFYTVHYRCRSGKAASLQEALEKGPTEEIIETKVVVIVDGKNRLIREVEVDVKNAPKPVMFKGTDGSESFSGPLLSYAGLTSGKFSLSHFGNARITKGFDPHNGAFVVENTTWNHNGISIGGDWGTVGKELEMAVDPNNQNVASLIVEPSTEIPGHATTKITYTWPARDSKNTRAGSSGQVFYVDKSRGFLALRYDITHDGKISSTAYTTDVRRCSHNRWFPTRCINFKESERASGKPFYVGETVVTKLEVDQRPRREDFQLTLSAETQVSGGNTSGATFTLEKPQVFTLDNLEEFYNKTQGSVAINNPTPSVPAWWQYWVAGGVVVGVLAFLYYLFRNRAAA